MEWQRIDSAVVQSAVIRIKKIKLVDAQKKKVPLHVLVHMNARSDSLADYLVGEFKKYTIGNELESVNIELNSEKIRWILKTGYDQHVGTETPMINLSLRLKEYRPFTFESIHLTVFTREGTLRTWSVRNA